MSSRADLQHAGDAVQMELFGETAERPWAGHRDVGFSQLMAERAALSRKRFTCTVDFSGLSPECDSFRAGKCVGWRCAS